MTEQKKQLIPSLAQVAIEVNSKVSAMSATYDELMKECLHYKSELEAVNKKYDELKKKQKK